MFEAITVSGLTDDENRVLNRLLRQLDDRRPRNILRQSHYEMKHLPRQAVEIVPAAYRNLGLMLGWNAKGVDGLRARCNLRGFAWAGGDLEDLGLSEFTKDNRLHTEVGSGITSSLIHSPSFLVNTSGGDGEPRSLLHTRSALVATGDYSPRTRRMENLISVTETDDVGRPTEIGFYLDGLTILCQKDGGWSVADRQEHPWGVPVEILRYKPRDGRVYGASRITRATMGLQDAAVRALIRLEGHMDVYSYPEMWVLGPDMSVFKNPDGSTKTAVQVMLGRVKAIPDKDGDIRADVKQFPASSPDPHLKQLNAFAKAVAREFDLPDSSFALTDYANPTSPESYVEGRDDLIASAETAMAEWGVSVERSVRRGLAILNDDPAIFDELRDIDAMWRSPLHLSNAAEADAGLKRLQAVPWLADTSVGLELLGLTDDQIKRAEAERRRVAGASVIDALAAQAPPEAPDVRSFDGSGT